MNTATLARLLSVGAIAAALSACNGGAAQPPKVPPSGPHTSSVFRDLGTSGSGRAASTVAIGQCTQVATSKGILYAKLVPTGAVDHANVDASNCDIGIYLGPSSTGQRIDHTSVTDANQYGIFADQAQNVTIDHTTVSKIGNHTGGTFAPNGVQTGVGLYFRGATGTVDHTDIFLYQKNGTAFNCLFDEITGACLKPSSVSMTHSTAVGLGQVGFIAQNGIQYLDSTAPQFEHNSATNNMYYNAADTLYNRSATGFLFLCTNVASESQLRAQHNDADHNDFNDYVDNNPADC
jgi:hypothetical protein